MGWIVGWMVLHLQLARPHWPQYRVDMGTITLDEKEFWNQYHPMARLEAEKLLPDKEGGCSWEELRAKEQEYHALSRQEEETRGIIFTDKKTLANARDNRMREFARRLAPELRPTNSTRDGRRLHQPKRSPFVPC